MRFWRSRHRHPGRRPAFVVAVILQFLCGPQTCRLREIPKTACGSRDLHKPRGNMCSTSSCLLPATNCPPVCWLTFLVGLSLIIRVAAVAFRGTKFCLVGLSPRHNSSFRYWPVLATYYWTGKKVKSQVIARLSLFDRLANVLSYGAFRDATAIKTCGAFRGSQTANTLHSTPGASAR